jgi:CheY-like chemotaxis protein
LADDTPDIQRLVSFILKRAGAEVVCADNGLIAYELAMEAVELGSPFDIVLMDMQMPIMDGYEATTNLRAAGYTGPIVALTAHAMPADRQKCIDFGCTDYAIKPIDKKKLLGLVSSLATSK